MQSISIISGFPIIPLFLSRIPVERTNVPAVQAVLGTKGSPRESITVVYRSSPRSAGSLISLYVIARMDSAEVYGPLRDRLSLLIAFVSLVLIGIGAGIGMIWRDQSTRFYRKLYESENALFKERERAKQYLEIVKARP